MKIAVQAWSDKHKQTERWFGWFECNRLAQEWAARLKRECCHVEMTVVEIDVNPPSCRVGKALSSLFDLHPGNCN